MEIKRGHLWHLGGRVSLFLYSPGKYKKNIIGNLERDSKEVYRHNGLVIYFRNVFIEPYKLNNFRIKRSTLEMDILIHDGMPDVLIIKHEHI